MTRHINVDIAVIGAGVSVALIVEGEEAFGDEGAAPFAGRAAAEDFLVQAGAELLELLVSGHAGE